MARTPTVRYRPAVKRGTQLPGGRPGYTINMSSGRGELREYMRIGPPAPLKPPTPVIRETSRPPRGNVQIIPPGGAPRRGPVVPQIDGRRPARQLRPMRYQTFRPWFDATRLPRQMLKVNPYFRAVSMGFDLMDAWSQYGPSTPEIPATEEGYDFTGTGWTIYEECPANGPALYHRIAHAPLGSPCLTGGSPFPESATLDTLPVQTAGASGRYRGAGNNYESATGLRSRYSLTLYLPPGVRGTPPTYQPAQPGQPARTTVQPSPTTTTPLPAAISESGSGPRNPARTYMPPYEVPAETLEVNPGGSRHIPNTPHVLAPPAPGGKELKIKVHAPDDPRKLASWLWDRVTHYDDLIDVIADSIEGNPCRSGTPQAKIVCIGRHLDKINPSDLIYNFAYNELEDRLVGKALSYSKNLPFGGMAPGRMGDRQPLNIRQLPK